MKKMKKIMALLLAGAMTMAMSFATFADEADAVATAATGTNTLTVNVKSGSGVPTQTFKDQTIYLYKLFDVTESGTTGSKNYAYTVNIVEGYKDTLRVALGTGFTGTVDADYADAILKLGADNTENVQNFANEFTTQALTRTPKLAATADSGKLGDVTSFGFTGLDAGYYLVYATGGKKIQSSLVMVDSTAKSINLKTEAPGIEKTANKETVNIGEVVTYTVTGTIPDTTGYEQYQYVIHDTLSKGLDFVNDATGGALTGAEVKVKVAFETGVTDAGTAPSTAELSGTDNRTMNLDLSTWVRANQDNKGKKFTVMYYAKVNKDAVVTEKNSATLEYGNNSGETTTTKPSEVKTPTYPIDVNKVIAGSTTMLAGAKFKLYLPNEGGAFDENLATVIKVTTVADGNYIRAVDQSDPAAVDEMVTAANAVGTGYNLHINGLAAGTYYLVETEAPTGYNKLTAPIKVTITKDGEADWTITRDDKSTPEADKIIHIENSIGSQLPSTGGRGTIAFAVVAVLLVFGVTVSYIRDKKKEA